MFATCWSSLLDTWGQVWRVGEGHQPLPEEEPAHSLRGGEARRPQIYTKCGNQYPSDARSADGLAATQRVLSPVNISTYGWVYTW